MVHLGEWPEEESRQLMQAKLDAIMEEFPVQSRYDIVEREHYKHFDLMMSMRNSDTMTEREYYFDEGLGQSLNDHIAEVKQQFPDVKLQTRRDRDGIPIVKMSLKQQFKYNLDEIMAINPDDLKRIQLETQEAITEILMPENPKEFVQAVDSGNVNIDVKAFEQLVHARIFGQYKEDLEGFKSDLRVLKNRGAPGN